MRDESLEFAGLVSARLCHDLLGPAGVLDNAVDLLSVEPNRAMQQNVLALMSSSAAAVAAKLRFFRLAFGTGGDMAQSLAVDELRQILTDFLADKPNIRLEWMINGARLPHPMARLLLLFVLLAGEGLPRGGVLDIAMDGKGAPCDIAVRARGDGIIFDDAYRQALDMGTTPAHDAMADLRTVPAQLAARLAARFEIQIALSPPDPAMLLLGATATV